jgi:ATP-dependent Lhr-like helicase
MERFRKWISSRGWKPFPFQEAAWGAMEKGGSGLITVPTGAGKTYAAYGPALERVAAHFEAESRPKRGLRVLYVTPLRAMARDLELALCEPADALVPGIRVEARTGDTSSSLRAKQRRQLPEVLLTTPESLTLLLSYADAVEQFRNLETIIVDEWHELLVSKRGTQTELALARLRKLSPTVQTWALSATIANPQVAAQTVVGVGNVSEIVDTAAPRELHLRTLLPPDLESQPWAGHYGLSMLPLLLSELDPEKPSIVFTNTRAQAETWFDALARALPDELERMAIHHGSLDRDERSRVEAGLKDGSLSVVVSTSSLDLGVDFSPVDRVFQIGSPKGVARLLQRGGRARHQPGVSWSEIICLPTNALQAIEFSAAREAIARREVEASVAPRAPLDVLLQHLVTVGLGGGFGADALFDEIRTAVAYADLEREAFDWCLDHLSTGGKTLRAYPEHHRLAPLEGGWQPRDPKTEGRRHRAMIGTIVSSGMVTVKYRKGSRLGQVEEWFISQLNPGDHFVLAGKRLEFLRFREMVVEVQPAKGRKGIVASYVGGRLPLTNQLARSLRREFDRAARGEWHSPELMALKPLLKIQAKLSAVPRKDDLLVEIGQTQEGFHCFVYPFAGRLVNDGLSALLGYRMARELPATFSVTRNDYGFELLCTEPFPWERWFCEEARSSFFTLENLAADTLAAINVSEMAKRQFRAIARISGLVFEGYPHQRKTTRQLQTSAELLYEVFARFDPENRLLQQAQREVLEEQFEQVRLEETLRRMQMARLVVRQIPQPTPLGLPLVADRLSAEMSTETVGMRVERARKRAFRR